MMRIMGLDYGTKTVGVAVSDPLGITAQAVETVTRKDENKLRKTLARIESLATEYGVEKFVIGFPKHMNNDIGERAEKALEFGEMLKRRTGGFYEHIGIIADLYCHISLRLYLLWQMVMQAVGCWRE